MRYENQLIVAEGDYVIAHGRFSGNGRPAAWVAADVIRFEDGLLAEHWDVLQDEATQAESVSGLPMFGRPLPFVSGRPPRNIHGTQIGAIMNLTGNTIFITGGGSGIGRALAEALHKRRNKVIISGRRKGHLDAVVKANPGIEAIELDIADPASIKATAKKLIEEHPDLNVLINNAGIMELDQAAGVIDDKLLVSTVTTNLLGPLRLTSALVDQLKSRHGVILYNTSVLAFVPLALTAVYSATT